MKIFFPGSFDPFTIGHENLILRAINIFKNTISANEKIEFDIAVAINPNKKDKDSKRSKTGKQRINSPQT